MFEPEDLAVASPATVSRCGMIYMEPKSLGFDPLLLSWLSTLPKCFDDEMKGQLMALFETYVTAALTNLRRNLSEPLPTVDNCLVQALMSIIDSLTDDWVPKEGVEYPSAERTQQLKENLGNVFVFALVWSLMITSTAAGRKWWNAFLRIEIFQNGTNCSIPSTGLVYDYLFDVAEWKWVGWMDTQPPYQYDASLTYSELIIPTKDSISYNYFLRLLVGCGKHVLMTGPTGTGKSVNVSSQLQGGFSDKFIPIIMTFSAQTSANQTQDLIDGKCEKRRKGVYGPQAGKRFILFVDDVNMPQKEEYGAQPPIEILRQWFDSDGWYDRKELTFRRLIDFIFVVACGPPGGGRNHVSARFYRHFNVIGCTEMQEDSMALIFETIFGNFLTRFGGGGAAAAAAAAAATSEGGGEGGGGGGGDLTEQLSSLCDPLVKASIDVYATMLRDMRPTPAKSHYQFNLRDLSKIFQGLLMIDPKKVLTKAQLARSWVHECRRIFCDRLINTDDTNWFHVRRLRQKTTCDWLVHGDRYVCFLLLFGMVDAHAILHDMGIFAASNTYMRIRERNNNNFFMKSWKAMVRKQPVDHADMQWEEVHDHHLHDHDEEAPEASTDAAPTAAGAKSPLSDDAPVIYCDFLFPGADPKIYEEVDDPSELQPLIEEYLSEFNSESKQPMHLVMFKDAIEHVARITRVLRQPQGNALLLGLGGSGRKSLTQLATFMAEYELYTIQIAKGYGMNEWRENLKECLLIAGVQDKPGELCRRRICVSVSPTTNRVKTNLTLTRTHADAPPKVVFMFDDTQIIMESMTEDINAILNSGDVPNLYAVEDLEEIASACKEDCVRKRIPQTKLNLFSCYLTRVRRNM